MGFVFRLAKRRGMPTGRMLAAEAGLITARKRASEAVLHRLADMANVDVSDLRAISYGPADRRRAVFRGVPISGALLQGRSSARSVCPACLAEAPYHRAVWDLTFSSACARHSCELEDTCPDCGRRLKWQGVDLARCVCPDGDLARMRPVPLERELLDGLRVACGLLGDESCAEEAAAAMDLAPLRRLPPGKMVEFMFRLGMDLAGGTRRKVFSLIPPDEPGGPSHEALHLGLRAARDWPTSFLGVPALLGQDLGKPSRRRTLWLAAVSRWLDGLQPGQAEAVREAVAAVRSGR